MISEYDKAHMDDILCGHGTWFTSELLRLIAKADDDNREKIRAGFPEEVEAYERWYYKDRYEVYAVGRIIDDTKRAEAIARLLEAQ